LRKAAAQLILASQSLTFRNATTNDQDGQHGGTDGQQQQGNGADEDNQGGNQAEQEQH